MQMVSHSSKVSRSHRQRNKERVEHPLEEEVPTRQRHKTKPLLGLHTNFQTTTREGSSDRSCHPNHRKEGTVFSTLCKQ